MFSAPPSGLDGAGLVPGVPGADPEPGMNPPNFFPSSLPSALLATLLSGVIERIANDGASLARALIGTTWKLNLAKSKFSPGPPPRSQTLSYQAEGQGIKATNEGIDAQGNPTKGVFLVFYDGKSYPVTGVPAYDASSYKQVNDSTVDITRTKAGRVVQTLTIVLSADGKSRTNTQTGVDEKGQQINNVYVWDKQ